MTATEAAAITAIAAPGDVRWATTPAMAAPTPCIVSMPEECSPRACPLSSPGVSAIRRSWRSRLAEYPTEASTTAVTATGSAGCTGGWAAALADLRPGMRWLGEGRLQINAHDYPQRKIAGAQLLFVPVTSRQGWVSWDAPHRYAVIYPCSGVLAEAGLAPVPEALGTLLGPGRAGVLVLLDTPKSTTQLVALTGQGLGSVGRHLKVLLDACLVQRRRAGRSVLYFRTAAGETLLEAQRNG